MADSSVRVEVRGLRELQGAFKAVDSDIPKSLRIAMKAIADHVVGEAQQKMPFISGEAAHSLKPRATQRGAGIAYPGGGPGSGKDKGAYYPWLDFGGRTGRKRSITREVIKGGRFLYPAIAESKQYIEDHVNEAVEDAAKRAGFEVRG